MRDSARFHFGFTVPYVSRISARPAAVEAVAASKGDLAMVSAIVRARTPWWNAAWRPTGAPKIIARLPFVERADHPAALPVFAISRVADDALVTEIETWSIRVSGWSADRSPARCRRWPMSWPCRIPPSTVRRCWSPLRDANRASKKSRQALIAAGASVRSIGPRRRPCERAIRCPADGIRSQPSRIAALSRTPVCFPGVQ